MRNTRKLVIVLNIGIAALLTLFLFRHIFRVFQKDYGIGRGKELVAQNLDYDVFLFGTSHMGTIQPMDLWKYGGVTSYNIYNSYAGMNRNLASLQLALDYHTPKLVIIDTDDWWKKITYEEKPGDYHRTFDIFPLSVHKARVIMRTVPEWESRKALLFNIYRYHSRYGELLKTDFSDADDDCLGSYFEVNYKFEEEGEQIPPDQLPDTDSYDLGPLREMIELCQSRNIAVMLICLPFKADPGAQEYQHVINGVAREYGLNFYNFLDDFSVVDLKSDLANGQHLNMLGARRMAEVLAALAHENYGIEDRRNDAETAALWDKKYEAYEACLDRFAADPENVDIRKAILLTGLDRYGGELYCRNSETNFLARPDMKELLKAVSGSELPGMERAADEGEDYLLILNRKSGVIQEYAGGEVEAVMGDTEDMDDALFTLRNAETLDIVTEIRENE